MSRKLGPKGSVPAYVALPKMHPSGGPAYLGAAHAPFVIDADPNSASFAVPDLLPPPAIAADRLDDRKKLLETVDLTGFRPRPAAISGAIYPSFILGSIADRRLRRRDGEG